MNDIYNFNEIPVANTYDLATEHTTHSNNKNEDQIVLNEFNFPFATFRKLATTLNY